jgi:hypothetical protein
LHARGIFPSTFRQRLDIVAGFLSAK